MKAVLLCDGEIPTKKQIRNDLSDASLFVAVDGGGHAAQRLELLPDVIIGDLDSYKPTGEETPKVIKDPDQETNDLEKALSYAATHSVTDVVVFGATGKRLDHTLKNLSVLLQFDSHFSSILLRDYYSTIELIHSPFHRKIPVGTSISLFPLSGSVENITTKGFKYPLTNGILKNGIQDGSSNQTICETIDITFDTGDLLFITNHQPIDTL